MLSKIGYGSILDLRKLDTDDILNLIEFEHISGAIEQHQIKQAR